MGLLADAAAVLDAGGIGIATIARCGRDPQAVAFARRSDCGAVMFLLRRTTGDWMAIVALLERRNAVWEEVALVHKPWWDPTEAFEDDELMLTGGHSRFGTGSIGEVVLVPGQAAPDTSVVSGDGHPDEVEVHPPWRHFIYLGELDRIDETVTLTARRDGVEQTDVFEPIGDR